MLERLKGYWGWIVTGVLALVAIYFRSRGKDLEKQLEEAHFDKDTTALKEQEKETDAKANDAVSNFESMLRDYNASRTADVPGSTGSLHPSGGSPEGADSSKGPGPKAQ